MKLPTSIKAIALIPLIIAGGFATLFFSYMLVPMLIAGSIGTAIYFYMNEPKDNQEYQDSNNYETSSQRRQRYISESRTFSQ